MNSRRNSILRSGFKTISFLLLYLCLFSSSQAQDFAPYEKHYFDTKELRLAYRLLKPLEPSSAASFPLVIFLHGAFEKGGDNEAQLNIGGRFFLRDSVRKSYPAYVLFPQCPEMDSWAYFENKVNETTGKAENWKFPFQNKPTEVSLVLKKLIDFLIRSERIDYTRIYIVGLSQGGMGVLDLVARYPETFAAGISICGAGNVNTAKRFGDQVALWLIHGEKDDVVPVSFSRNYYKKLTKLNADVRYSEYPEVMHDSWVSAFKEPEFLMWLFSKRKK
jgi:predicted peptidase